MADAVRALDLARVNAVDRELQRGLRGIRTSDTQEIRALMSRSKVALGIRRSRRLERTLTRRLADL